VILQVAETLNEAASSSEESILHKKCGYPRRDVWSEARRFGC
jgi:hypothetical protein